MTGISRRELMAGVAGSAVIGGTALRASPAAAAPARVPLRQGTHLAARLSPDRRRIAMDLAGVLWVLPAAGGPARRLTGDFVDIAQPDWAPDSAELVFQAYRDGVFDLWTVRADGSRLRRLTRGPFDHREPRFSPDGTRIAYSTDESGSYGIRVLDLASGAVSTLADSAEQEYEPAWSPDGRRVAFVVTSTRIDVVDVAGGARETAVSVPAGQVLRAPEWTPDGTELVYHLLAGGRSELWRNGTPEVTGEDVFPFRVSWRTGRDFVYTSTGEIRRRTLGGTTSGRIGFVAPISVTPARYRKRRRDFDSVTPKPVRGIGSPVLSPDGTRIAFRALNDIWTMTLGGRPEPLTRDRWWKSDPAWSPDGRYLSYSTDRGGKLDIWLRDLRTGADRQLTALPGAAAVSGSWSADGSHLAFLDQTGALYTVEVATGAVRQIYPATFEPGRPTWSADGNTIALAAIVPYSARFREGLSKILLVDRNTGAGRYVDPLPHRSLQTRGDDGPVWSPDGTRLAFVLASVLWVVDVRPDGSFAGTPRQITDEVTDAPSWSGDSTTLLYLNNGRLRLVPAAGGPPRTVPMTLTWANTRPRGRIVIHAGRVWDGVAPRLREDVDIVVEGHRIVAVEPHRPGRDGRRIDARDAVVTPGLIDMHHHREMQGYGYGDRQGRLWLALGVTTTRSPGSPAYHMVEEREAIQSGARTGPRYFGTGEAIDGARIFYNFMRPTYDEHQLARELQRAAALDYDLTKCYVRLRASWQRHVIAWSHRHGIPSTSHYHHPALAVGGDGMEHVGATNRLGYSRTVTGIGAVYRDVADIFTTTRAALTPTLFNAVTLLGDDDSLVTDERVRTLYPSWEYANLQTLRTTAATTDQTAVRANLARQVAHVRTLVRGGGRVVTGTDSPIAPNAVSTHLNLRAMVTYGLTPYEALTTATRAAGDYLGEPLGTIAPGRYADLAVLGGDPLTDIRQAANVRQVMTNGEMLTVAELLRPFAGPRPVTAPASPVTVLRHAADDGYWWQDPHYLAESRHACCADG
ncbi:amidohydrolase family protein [Jidongwangia harbinensis]|uniref:amidohydrolase family protein n=1 Tax=Jidongwangia harbinensis TaxID=2878561 RepID=UPI001CD94D75|nr:amidohydrolase family protein [Jidongwangia harbinensis]MCA2215971.1 amidohydrolase family protein [Jidongwangia harbinensis]